jgi:uncharacterized protein YciI
MLRPALCSRLVLAAALAAGAGAAPARAAPADPVRYQLGLLSRGPTWTPEQSAHTDSVQAGHMANIVRMAAAGALVAAGPFENGGDLRGLFVFAPEADSLGEQLAADPAIASGRLQCRLSTWVAPPGLGDEYRQRAAARAQAGAAGRDSMVTFGWVMLHRGPKYDSRPTPSVEKLIREHFEYTETLRANGMLVYAGAIEGTGDLRGVLVMQGDSASIARAIRADPAVRAGRFTPNTLRWWTAWGTIPGH